MSKLILSYLTIVLLSGCASNIVNEVRWLEREISDSSQNIAKLETQILLINQKMQDSKAQISSLEKSLSESNENIANAKRILSESEQYLASNLDVFIDGQCVRPKSGRKPKPYCDSRKAAKEHALAYCSMSIGCDVAMVAMDEKLDSFAKRFLASEACSQMVSRFNNEGYSPDSTVINALEALSETGCSNKESGFWNTLGKIAGCVASASIKLQKIQSYFNCVNKSEDACYAKYKDWLNVPIDRQNACIAHLDNIKSQPNLILSYEQQVANNKMLIEQHSHTFKQNSISIAIVEGQLKEERKRQAMNARLLEEQKKTLSYKIYGNG